MLPPIIDHNTSVISLYKIIPSELGSCMLGLIGDFLYGDSYSNNYVNLEIYDIIYEKNAAMYNRSILEYYLSLINCKDAKQTLKMCMALVKYNGMLLDKITFKNNIICEAAVVRNYRAFKYVPVEFKTNAICIATVSHNNFSLHNITDQTEAICIAAVTRNGCALQFVTNQTDAICITAAILIASV